VTYTSIPLARNDRTPTKKQERKDCGRAFHPGFGESTEQFGSAQTFLARVRKVGYSGSIFGRNTGNTLRGFRVFLKFQTNVGIFN
jgi:hypothetical protein